ncbi:hypothetical protein EON80_07570 [bacterium]|nr:MAG: hypothetical protein EON80_07570 [bacterium]
METKLWRGIYLTFGITFALIVAMIVVWKLKFYDEVNAQITKKSGELDTQTTTAAKLSDNLLKAAIAKDRGALAKQQLTYLRSRYRSLNFDLTDNGRRNITWQGYMNEYFANFGLEMRRELVQAAQDTDVILNTSLKVDAPPPMPENVVAPPSGFLTPVTGKNMTVDVVGSLPDILRFLQRINRSAILMSVGGIKVEGASPLTKATFTISPYLVAKGKAVDAVLTGAAPAAPAATSPDGLDPALTPPAP